jgi:hypothetical protein
MIPFRLLDVVDKVLRKEWSLALQSNFPGDFMDRRMKEKRYGNLIGIYIQMNSFEAFAQ